MISKGVVILAGFIATMLAAPFAYADGVVIPGSIKVEKFKRLMLERGMDLSGGDEADGYVENNGTKIKVVTYMPVTIEQLDQMKEASTMALREV